MRVTVEYHRADYFSFNIISVVLWTDKRTAGQNFMLAHIAITKKTPKNWEFSSLSKIFYRQCLPNLPFAQFCVVHYFHVVLHLSKEQRDLHVMQKHFRAGVW